MFKKFLNPKIFLLILIFVLAGFIRFWGIYHGSFAFTFDVGRDLLAVKKILDGKPTLIGSTTGIPGVFYGPWWYYLLTLFFLVSGGNPALIAAVIALLGLINIYLAYILGGLVLASLVAFSPHFVGTSVQIWNPNLVPFFLLASFVVFKKLLEKITWHFFFIFGLLTMLLAEMELAFGIFYLLGISVGLFFFSLRKKGLLFFFLGILFVELPRFLFELRHGFLQTNALINFFSETRGNWPGIVKSIISQFNLFLGELSFSLGLRNNLLVFLILLVLIFLLVKNWGKFARQEKIFLKVIGITILFLFLGFTFYPQTVWSYYLVGLPSLFFLALALIFNNFLKVSRQNKLAIAVFICLILFNLNLPSLWAGIKNPRFKGDAAVYRNQIGVIDYIYKDAKGEKFNVVAYTPPLIDYTWRYHFIWYGQKNYGYQPSVEKVRLFYLIEEPDFENPQRLEDWLEQRKEDGELVEKEEVSGGIVVEKRKR